MTQEQFERLLEELLKPDGGLFYQTDPNDEASWVDRCDHTLSRTRAWMSQQGVAVEENVVELERLGASCDCEVYYHVEHNWRGTSGIFTEEMLEQKKRMEEEGWRYSSCPYCPPHASVMTRRDDLLLAFDNGHRYVIPPLLSHFIFDHYYCPDDLFLQDVMQSQGHVEPPGTEMKDARRVGFLDGTAYKTGPVPEGFAQRLGQLLQKGSLSGRKLRHGGKERRRAQRKHNNHRRKHS
jgi:hypothetical protein